MPYRVSHHPKYGWRWWHPTDSMPADEMHVKDADDAELAVIRRIENAAGRNALPPPDVIARFQDLAGRTRLI